MSNGLGGEGHPGGVREGAEAVRGIFRPERDKAGGEGQPGGSPRKRACGSTQVRIYGLPQGAREEPSSLSSPKTQVSPKLS